MSEPIHARGSIHGQAMALEEPISLPEGEAVELTITRAIEGKDVERAPGEGICRSAGAWADDTEELDEFLKWNPQQRKQSRPEIHP
jgi:hypothetical protein